MDILENLLEHFLERAIHEHPEEDKNRLDKLNKWADKISLIELQKTLGDICSYDVAKFPGVIFEKEDAKIPLPLPSVLKPYLNQEEIFLSEAKAYISTLYILKTSSTAYKYGLITLTYCSIYSLLKQKMKHLISFQDSLIINSFEGEDFADLIIWIAKKFLGLPPPYGLKFQLESKSIELINKEDLIGFFICNMSSHWVTKFTFSQGFLGISVISTAQFIFNAQRLVPFLRWVLGGFGLVTFCISISLFVNSLSIAQVDLSDIDKIKSGCLKYLAYWLSPEAHQRAKREILSQYLNKKYYGSLKQKINTLAEGEQWRLFLLDLRKYLQKINPLLSEEQIFGLLCEGLEYKYSWQELELFLDQTSQEETLKIIDQIVSGKENIRKKVNKLRKIIKTMASNIREHQIRELIIELIKESQDLDSFRMLIMKRLQKMGLAKSSNIIDRIANMFIFLD